MAIAADQWLQYLEKLVPHSYALAEDPIGLQVGDPQAHVRGVLIALDVTEALLHKAKRQRANWVLVHHAPLYRPLLRYTHDQPVCRLLKQAGSLDLQIFVMHTNLDAVPWGINGVLAERLALENTKVLLPHPHPTAYKLAVYVPKPDVETVRNALFTAGAGQLGFYKGCSFSASGRGTFTPEEGAHPAIGQAGQRTQVEEEKIETAVPISCWPNVREAMLKVHPYEEVAYDLYPLHHQSPTLGLGRLGELSAPCTLVALAEQVKQAYGTSHVRYVGAPETRVHKIALLGGAGAKSWREARQQGADVYITGDIGYHDALEATAAGLCLIDPGHHVEWLGLAALAAQIRATYPELGVEVEEGQNPFSLV